MKIKINRTILNNAIGNVIRAVSSKNLIPILSSIKLEANDNQLILIASNTDISIEKIVEDESLKIEEPGSIVLKGQLFSNIIKKFSGDVVTIETDGNQTKIASGRSELEINSQAGDAFINLPIIDDDDPIKLKTANFKPLIDQTIKAVSKQETRPILTGIHLSLDNNKIKSVATDSHRLAQTSTMVESVDDFDVVISARSLDDLNHFLELYDQVEFSRSTSQLKFDFGDLIFYSQILEGQYPQTDQLIPTESSSKVIIDSNNLDNTIQRAALISQESRNLVVKLDINGSKAIISSSSQDVGNISEELENAEISGEDLSISFNPIFLLDALNSLHTNKVELEFTTNLRPFTIRPIDSDNIDQIQLVTPVRTF